MILNSIVERRLPGARDIFFFALVQIGLFFVLGGFNISLTSTNKTGAILALIAAISYSIYIIINQQTGKKNCQKVASDYGRSKQECNRME